MSDDLVEIPFGDKNAENATLLLAAAEELGLDPHVVRTVEGGFSVPKEVHDKAFPKKGGRRKKDDQTESEEG